MGPPELRFIGDSLGVDAVLEGSVRRVGGQIRVIAQLIDTDDGFHRWSESYQRAYTTEDVLDIQEGVARAIVDRMAAADGGGGGTSDPGEFVRRHEASVESYDLYLRARFHWNQRRPEDLETAVGLYERALAADSTFALALWQTGRRRQAIERLAEDMADGMLVGLPPEHGDRLRAAFDSGGAGAAAEAALAIHAEWREGGLPRESRFSSPVVELAPVFAYPAADRESELLEIVGELIERRNLGYFVVDLAADPALDPLRDDPRFRELLRRVGLGAGAR